MPATLIPTPTPRTAHQFTTPYVVETVRAGHTVRTVHLLTPTSYTVAVQSTPTHH